MALRAKGTSAAYRSLPTNPEELFRKETYSKVKMNFGFMKLKPSLPTTCKVYEKELKLEGVTGWEPGFIHNPGYLTNNQQQSFQNKTKC